MLRFFLALFLLMPIQLSADVWVDEDGYSAVKIDDDYLSIYSLDANYFFDILFTDVRQGTTLQLCVGFDDAAGIGSDCLGSFTAVPEFYNDGKNRALHLYVRGLSFVFTAFEDYLHDGRVIKVSIDNADLFSAYSLHRDNQLNESAKEILRLQD